MSILDRAEAVLKAAGEPLHYREITRRMLAEGWQTESKTPHLTVNSLLSVELQDGDAARFVRVSRGVYALRHAHSPSVPVPRRKMSFPDAAVHLLSQTEDREPMHYSALAEAAVDGDLVTTESVNPATTLYSSIYQEIRRRETRGEALRLVIHKGGRIGLASWLPTGLASEIQSHNETVRRQLLDRLLEQSSKRFEESVAELLVELGFEDVEVTRISGDGGIDVRGTLVVGEVVRTRMAVQAKRWKSNVQAPTVQQVRGSLGAHEQGLIITTSDFSSGARTEAKRPDAAPVALMNGEQLAALLAEHEIGVRREEYDLFSLDDLAEPDA